MKQEFLHYPAAPVALKMAVAVGIGLLIGLERRYSNKEIGIRTFSIVAFLGMISVLAGNSLVIAGIIGVFLLITYTNIRSILVDRTLEITTSAALIADYLLGILVGQGHIFTPVAGAVVLTMLLAWKEELNRFAGDLEPHEIRSAILLGLIGFVIYPIMPDRYVDIWNLFNPSDAWVSVIAISGIGFVNYVLLRIFSTNGLYISAIFGGLINSSATIVEISSRAQTAGMASKINMLCLLTTIAMFARNLLLVLLFSPASLTSALLPIAAMTLVAALWIWKDYSSEKDIFTDCEDISPKLDSPISLRKVLWFGFLFVIIQVGGTLLTRLFGSYGIIITGIFGGFVSSASTTAAAATMASHGQIAASVAGSVAIISSIASAVINLPLVWRVIKDKAIVRKLTITLGVIFVVGITVVFIDRMFGLSELIIRY